MLLTYLRKLDLPSASDLSKKQLYHLLIAYVLISAPMVTLFPLWLSGLVLLTLGLKLASIKFHFTVSKWIAFTILVGAIMLIALNFNAFGKEYAGVALLLVFASLKLLEAREQRDAFLLMLIYLLLIMGSLMAQQSPFAFLYLVSCFLYNIYIQMRIAQPDNLGISLRQNLKAIAKILLISLPFVLVLFFLFPRIDPLWKQPGLPRATTGLSDEMSPNSLSQLALDGGMAFRVKFTDDVIPDSSLLYWRGPVLVNFDGKTWRRDAQNRVSPETLTIDESSKVDYTIYHDGSTKYWVVPLDIPASLPKSTAQTYWNTYFEMGAPEAIAKPTAFSLTSYTRYRTGKLSAAARRQQTFLPTNIFPKTRELAAQLYKSSANDEDFAHRAWQYFRDNTFYYDLEPPLGNSDIDRFLFENQVGYCEHYASTFVFMMRSQGVPSRVVTGYQGGERNLISGELEVKQLNAHAWAEVYFSDKGWVRFDPTAAVAPERVNSGSPFGVARNTDSIALGARWENQSESYRKLTSTLRAMNAFWQNWVINYNSDKQHSLWQKLGLSSLKYVAWIILLIALVPLVLGLVWLYRRRRQRQAGDKVWQTMQPFMRYLEKQSLAPSASQPLTVWVSAQAISLGGAQKYAENVVKHYYQLRYADNNHPNTEKLRALSIAIERFIEKHQQIQQSL